MTKLAIRTVVFTIWLVALAPRPAAAATCTAKYYGGPIIQNPKVIAVFWSDSVPAATKSTMPAFYTAIVASSFFDWLTEYNTVGLNGQDGQPGSNQGISRGSFGGSFTLTPSVCPGAVSCTMTDDQIQQELAAQITAGHLPAPTLGCDGQNNTIYAVHFPANVKITYAGGSASCVTFCGYHSDATYNGKAYAYTVNADVTTGGCAGGCGMDASPINNQTAVANQELFNAITDPSINAATAAIGRPLGWYADSVTCGEIGSICNGQEATVMIGGTTWTVSKVWSNVAAACITTRSSLPAICTGAATPTGCRSCTCADDAQGASGQIGCSGATPHCDTVAASSTHGQCVATGTGGAGGNGGSTGGGAGGAGGGGGAAGGAPAGSGGATGGSGGGTGGKPDGTEGGACYGNGTCNMGLTCLSQLCVMAPKSGGGCGCAVGEPRAGSALALAALALGFVVRRSRRRRG